MGARAAGCRQPTCRQRLLCLSAAGDAQALIVPVRSHVRLHQEHCIKQQAQCSGEGDAGRGTRGVIGAQPALLSSAEVKNNTPQCAALYYAVPEAAFTCFLRQLKKPCAEDGEELLKLWVKRDQKRQKEHVVN